MKEKLIGIKDESMQLLNEVKTIKDIDELKVKYLGKKGEITQILKGMKDLSKEERPVMGALVNEVREEIEKALEDKKTELNEKILEKKLHDERIDVTLKTDDIFLGHRHPLKKTLEDLEDLFTHMGFTAVSYTHLTLPTKPMMCRCRWSPYH